MVASCSFSLPPCACHSGLDFGERKIHGTDIKKQRAPVHHGSALDRYKSNRLADTAAHATHTTARAHAAARRNGTARAHAATRCRRMIAIANDRACTSDAARTNSTATAARRTHRIRRLTYATERNIADLRNALVDERRRRCHGNASGTVDLAVIIDVPAAANQNAASERGAIIIALSARGTAALGFERRTPGRFSRFMLVRRTRRLRRRNFGDREGRCDRLGRS